MTALVTGAAGRMGQMVIEAISERKGEIVLTAAVERNGHPSQGNWLAPGVRLTDNLLATLAVVDVLIDFTSPAAAIEAVTLASEHEVAAVIGTTGLDRSARRDILRAAERIPIVMSANFSIGVNVLSRQVAQASMALGPEFDAEIVELHHGQKRDAPSGTALALGEAVASGRGVKLDDVKRLTRDGEIGPRTPGEIGIMALRGGDVVGDHTVYFLGPDERIEITHRASSRKIFARGAVRAALWVRGKPAGLYTMQDVLGF